MGTGLRVYYLSGGVIIISHQIKIIVVKSIRKYEAALFVKWLFNDINKGDCHSTQLSINHFACIEAHPKKIFPTAFLPTAMASQTIP